MLWFSDVSSSFPIMFMFLCLHSSYYAHLGYYVGHIIITKKISRMNWWGEGNQLHSTTLDHHWQLGIVLLVIQILNYVLSWSRNENNSSAYRSFREDWDSCLSSWQDLSSFDLFICFPYFLIPVSISGYSSSAVFANVHWPRFREDTCYLPALLYLTNAHIHSVLYMQ